MFQMPYGPSSYLIMVFINGRANLNMLLSCAQYKTSSPLWPCPGGTFLTPNLILVLNLIKGDSSGEVIQDSYLTSTLWSVLQIHNTT